LVRRDLVERARAGDRGAFADLVAASVGRLYNVAQLMLRDRYLAEDAVQEALVIAWRDLRGLRDPEAFEGWLHRVLIRCVYREAHRERRSARVVTRDDRGHHPDSAGAVADRDAIEQGFRRLHPEHRAVLVLHHYLGMSDREAGEALGVPAGTVRSRLSRATAALRSELEAEARGVGLAMESIR
jgi:RNA polymerase sigma-70 factor (ECF subfamily)